MKKRFTEERIIGFLREAETGVAAKDLRRRHGFSGADFDSGEQAPDNSANKTFPNNALSFKYSAVPWR